MANFVIHKFRFPESIKRWDDCPIIFSQTANDLMDNLAQSELSLILCGLEGKDDLLEIINFYQKKKSLKDLNLYIVIVDFQGGGKLREAAQRLTIDRLINGEQYLAQEEEVISTLIEEMEEAFERPTSHHTYEDLFASPNTIVVKKNTKRRIYPVESVIKIDESPIKTMTEAPVVSFKLFDGDKLIESTFVDYFDKEVILRTKELPTDNSLILEFKFTYLGDKKGLRLKTEVASIEEEDGEYIVTLKVASHLKELEVMFKVFQKREQNITQFLKKVKGY